MAGMPLSDRPLALFRAIHLRPRGGLTVDTADELKRAIHTLTAAGMLRTCTGSKVVDRRLFQDRADAPRVAELENFVKRDIGHDLARFLMKSGDIPVTMTEDPYSRRYRAAVTILHDAPLAGFDPTDAVTMSRKYLQILANALHSTASTMWAREPGISHYLEKAAQELGRKIETDVVGTAL